MVPGCGPKFCLTARLGEGAVVIAAFGKLNAQLFPNYSFYARRTKPHTFQPTPYFRKLIGNHRSDTFLL